MFIVLDIFAVNCCELKVCQALSGWTQTRCVDEYNYFLMICFNIAGEKETMTYFAAHFEEQLKLYKKQVSHSP